MRRAFSLATLWAIFAIMFAGLAFFHFRSAYQTSPHFIPPERPLAQSGSVQVLGMDIDAPMKEFAKSFNSYVDAQNDSSKMQNIASMFGYILASLTALFSLIVEISPRKPNNTNVSDKDASKNQN